MTSAEAALLSMMIWPISFVWVVIEFVLRPRVARGTRQRYLFATYERALRYPALIAMVVNLHWDFTYGHKYNVAFDLIALAFWAWAIKKKRDGDQDDDFWTGFGKRMKQRLMSPSGSRAAAGNAA